MPCTEDSNHEAYKCSYAEVHFYSQVNTRNMSILICGPRSENGGFFFMPLNLPGLATDVKVLMGFLMTKEDPRLGIRAPNAISIETRIATLK